MNRPETNQRLNAAQELVLRQYIQRCDTLGMPALFQSGDLYSLYPVAEVGWLICMLQKNHAPRTGELNPAICIRYTL